MRKAGSNMASTLRAETPREIPDIETSSAGYASRFAGRHGAYFLRVQRETVLAALPDGSHQSVLEIGGGHGQLAAPLASAGYHVTVFGSSAACRERVGGGSHNNPIYFVTGDILHLPFPDNSFDIVVSVRLLSHMENWRGLISQICPL